MTFVATKSHCLIKLSISSKYHDFGFNRYQESSVQGFSHLIELTIKFDLNLKVMVNLGSLVEQTLHSPHSHYIIPRQGVFDLWFLTQTSEAEM